MQQKGFKPFIAELLGTFFLVFFICSTVSVASGIYGPGTLDFAVLGLVHFFVLVVLIFSLADSSGAHFNPAVTVALTVARRISPGAAIGYILFQLGGGVLGALVCKLLLDDEGDGVNYGATLVSERYLQGKGLTAMFVELIGTFVLVWAVISFVSGGKTLRSIGPLVVGGALGLAVMVFAPLTGAGFNPARSFGPAIVSGEWADFWAYVVGPLAGGILAVIGYKIAGVSEPDTEPITATGAGGEF